MVQTVIIDLQTSFCVGVLVALAAHRQIFAEQTTLFSRYVSAGALFGGVYGLAVGWMCAYFPDWMWAYAVDAASWPLWWWYPPFVLGNVVAGAAGTMMAQAFLSRGSLLGAVGVGLVGVVLLVMPWSLTFDAYMHITTYQGWHHVPRTATPLQSHAFAQSSINVIGAFQVLFGVGLLGKFLLEGRRLPRL